MVRIRFPPAKSLQTFLFRVAPPGTQLADDTPEEREQLHRRLGALDDDIPF